MVMLELMHACASPGDFTIAVAHCNHRLRGDASDQDEEFVAARARILGIPCYTRRVDTAAHAETRKLSIQESARELRYAFLEEVRKEHAFRVVATAHHADDQAETLLFRFLRGSGIRGLRGIPISDPARHLIRPLLPLRRAELETYALRMQVSHREDCTNATDDYTRNFLRHKILPQLTEVNPNVAGTLVRTGQLFRSLDEYLAEITGPLFAPVILERSETGLVIDRERFMVLHPFLQGYLLHTAGRELLGHDAEWATVQSMIAVAVNETGSQCAVSGTWRFFRDRGRLLLRREEDEQRFCIPVESGRAYELGGYLFRMDPAGAPVFSDNQSVEYADAEAIKGPLVLRNWEKGDWFIPLGMSNRRKVSDFFIDEKIPLFEKNSVPILVSDGKIVWICGKRLDDRFKISPKTQSAVKLEYRPR